MTTYDRLTYLSGVIQAYAVFAVLMSLYALTFPGLQRDLPRALLENFREETADLWILLTVTATGLVLALAFWHRRRSPHTHRSSHLLWGQGLIGLSLLLMMTSLFLPGKLGGLIAIGFNLLLFAGVVWLVVTGLHLNDRFYINIAFVFFGLTLMSRYLDTFWSLLNRSFFFMAGGVILIGGGLILERQRRKLTRQIAGRSVEGGGV
ncbi:MAG: hypothetical protein ABIF87_15530 [Pseudomonadota bacterium]